MAPASARSINTAIYDELGDRWYTAKDDPVALLRAESRLRNPWVVSRLQEMFGPAPAQKVLDIGCGGGFLSNYLAAQGYKTTGIDLSEESLEVARHYDRTHSVRYAAGDAYHLPFGRGSFDVVCAMDLLEHVEEPARVIEEASRVLAPGGVFFFHTFNRNWVSNWVAIKMVEWWVPNTPRDLHLHRMFIRPGELETHLRAARLEPLEWIGVTPRLFRWSTLRGIFRRHVPDEFQFRFTSSLRVGYSGIARKRV